MGEVFKNNWVINIVTGIIVFLITSFIQSWLLKKRSNVEYWKSVDKANRDMVDLIRKILVEQNYINPNIFLDIKKSKCLENKINENDAITIGEMKSILIKEVYEAQFLPMDAKHKIINKIYIIFNKINMRKIRQDLIGINLDKNVNLHQDERERKRRLVEKLYIASMIPILMSIIVILLLNLIESEITLFNGANKMNNNVGEMFITSITLILIIFIGSIKIIDIIKIKNKNKK